MSKKTRSKPQNNVTGSKTWPYTVWALLAGLWLITAAALVSHSTTDWPAHHVYPHNPQHANWVGRFGAVLSYKLYLLFGPGIWLVMTAAAAGLVRAAMGKKIDQFILRVVGVILMALATSALIGLMMPNLFSAMVRPEGTGGLIAVFINGELTDRFSSFGTGVILLVAFWIGAILTADQLVMAIPTALGTLLTKVGSLPFPRPVLVGALGRTQRAGAAGATSGGGGGTATVDPDEDVAPAKSQRIPIRSGGKAIEPEEPIDEDAGGLGGTQYFDPNGQPAATAEAPAKTDDVVAEVDEDESDDADESEEADDAAEHDAPGAYLDEKKPFDPDALREKIKKMPINFAPKSPRGGPKEKSPVSSLGGGGQQDLTGYKFPGLDLLEDPEHDFTDEMEKIVRDQAVALESALQEYRIEGEVVGIDSGPVITLYEVRLAAGTKVSRINTVANDLARALKAQNIRVVPTIVGKDTIGIEVPNIKKEKVRLKELMTAGSEMTAKMKLPMFLGKDASGNPLIADLAAMPHMLIAGTTGSGKSVCMNSIIMSFLFTKRPDELKLVLVDPKMVEMSLFRDIPHLMCPVVTEMNKAAMILEWAVTKMDERYELLAEVGVRDIAGYNALTWEEIKERMQPTSEEEEIRIPKKLPFMVFVIDELADLMMTNKEVEGFIVRIAQKARAVGIHLILATQRPQANVVTGLIKSNMPCRITFKVASGMDSRIVLDQKGGELLLGQGDMLYLSPRTSKLIRAQGSLVDDMEIRMTVKFLKEIAQQNFEPQLVQIKSVALSEEDSGERDELFEDAVRVVLETRRGSVSLLQRRLTIGYARASRLIEQMGEAGIIGEYKGSQAREVTMTVEEWDAMREQAAADAAAASATAPAEGEEPQDAPFDADGEDDDDDTVPDEMDNEYKQ